MPSTPVRGSSLQGFQVLAINFLPGLLAGLQLGGLLFFLNPELPFGIGPLLRASATLGGLLGTFSVLVLTPFTWGRPGRARRLLPWSITVVLALSAVLDGIHASRFSLFLPPGINVRLIKAALILGFAALIFFYTALLHSLQRRPYGLRGRTGLTLLALASVYAVGERREAFEPQPVPTPLPSVVELEQRPSLLVVGLDGATLDAVLPLAKQGHLSFFARLLEEGTYARLSSFGPSRPAAQWTTLATGKLPFKHGVSGDRVHRSWLLGLGGPLRLRPEYVGFGVWGDPLLNDSPLDSRLRRSLALWEILHRLGVPTGVLGWPATDPVPADLEFAFSDRYFTDGPRPARAAPEELAERGLLFRVAPEEIDPDLSSALGERVPFEILAAVAHDLWRQSLAEFLWEQRSAARARFLLLPGLAEVSRHTFGGYSYSQFEGTQRRSHQQAEQSLLTYYRHLDDFLARIWERTEGQRLLVVASAHGFAAPAGLGRVWRSLTGRGLEGLDAGAPDGLLLLAGEGIQSGKLLEAAALVDVMPTLLYGLGFPIARDLDGQVLTGAFEGAFLARHPLTFVPSYETLAGLPAEPAAAVSPPS